ncbi:MAG: periplasmic heavy metal sensor [Deltaproteobacteria bacterium]|nr:periplasmic heavy metal sensor [Deltaproteobacteria bacterium]
MTVTQLARLLLFAGLCASGPAFAEGPPGPPGPPGTPLPPGRDPLFEHLFPPELVMANQSTIALSEVQRSAIIKEMKGAQGQFVDLQWKVQEQAERVGQLLSANPIDEAKAAAEADKLMDIERQMKRTHLLLLVRIKNVLGPEQHEKLRGLRRSRPPPGPPPVPSAPPPH